MFKIIIQLWLPFTMFCKIMNESKCIGMQKNWRRKNLLRKFLANTIWISNSNTSKAHQLCKIMRNLRAFDNFACSLPTRLLYTTVSQCTMQTHENCILDCKYAQSTFKWIYLHIRIHVYVWWCIEMAPCVVCMLKCTSRESLRLLFSFCFFFFVLWKQNIHESSRKIFFKQDDTFAECVR